MAQQQPQPATGSGILDSVPLFVVVLLAAHVLALVRPARFILPLVPPPPRDRTLRRLIPTDPDPLPLFPLAAGVLDVQVGLREAAAPEEDAVTPHGSTRSLACPFGRLGFRTEVILQKV
ncbi:unnamed protein product [Urochloa decumbens]|uniref:Uncharacterized protein n=1 Tax=Urochloa decumbens TaxID=240449 RepID=A0ABC8VE60_9POAL